MLSKRTAIILIIAIGVFLIFESNYLSNKMNDTIDNANHTNAQISLVVDGETVNLEGTEISFNYTGAEKPLTSTLGKLNETGYEKVPNNAVAFKPCEKGSNKFSFTIPKDLIPTYNSDLTVTFGYEKNEADFNNYSLIINLSAIDETSLNAQVSQTVYYPDENGEALNKKGSATAVITAEDSKIECIIK